MSRTAWCFGVLGFFAVQAVTSGEDNAPAPHPSLPTGLYAVERDGLKEKDVLPLKGGEALIVHKHRYLKKDDHEPPRYLVVRSTSAVLLDLAEAPKAVKDGDVITRILLKLRPKEATALEQLTRERLGRHVAIVVDGEVVTMHKIRTTIKGGEVQITNCAPGAAGFLLKQLEALPRR